MAEKATGVRSRSCTLTTRCPDAYPARRPLPSLAAYESAATPGNGKTNLLLIDRAALPALVRLAEYLTTASSASNPVNADAVAEAAAANARPQSMISSSGSTDGNLADKARTLVFAPHASILVAVRLNFATRLLPAMLAIANETFEGASRRRSKFPALSGQMSSGSGSSSSSAAAAVRRESVARQLSEPTPDSADDDSPATPTVAGAGGRAAAAAEGAAKESGAAGRPSLMALSALGGSGGISVGGASKALMALTKLKKAAQQTSQLTLDIARPETGNHPYIFYLRDLLMFLRVRHAMQAKGPCSCSCSKLILRRSGVGASVQSERDLMDELIPAALTRSIFASMLSLAMQGAGLDAQGRRGAGMLTIPTTAFLLCGLSGGERRQMRSSASSRRC